MRTRDRGRTQPIAHYELAELTPRSSETTSGTIGIETRQPFELLSGSIDKAKRGLGQSKRLERRSNAITHEHSAVGGGGLAFAT